MWKPPRNDMQGPCPDGFHIATRDEWLSLISIMTALGLSDATNYRNYLKIPATGYLNRNGNIQSLSGWTWIWTNTNMGEDFPDSLYLLQVRDGYGVVAINSGINMSYGLQVRPYKDEPTTPDSSWTALYSNRIYQNTTLGLISLSSDGTTWITIADKNLGAENVNDIGNYYQRGNNYGFPQSGFTTSDTQVDASNYGPGNYYSSSIWITTNPRDSSINLNLRGAITKHSGGDIQIRPVIRDIIADFLLVGGGGAGGGSGNRNYSGGGGGAGGFIECCNYLVNSGSYCISIGEGGQPGAAAYPGGNGGNSEFNGVIAYGGGGGGGYTAGTGCSGGSGGGGGGCGNQIGGAGCSGQGNAGAKGCYTGGGGGGAGGAGCYCNTAYGGTGGVGKCSCISGVCCWYAGGGGGGGCRTYSPGAGGCGGGGSIGAATYYGGGGGGSQYCCNTAAKGWAGCQGVFILRYPTACGYIVSGGNCIYTCGDYTIHCFTSNGTLKVGD